MDMECSKIPRSSRLHTSLPLQEALVVNFVPGSALAKSDFCAVIVVFFELRLNKATYISPAITKREYIKIVNQRNEKKRNW